MPEDKRPITKRFEGVHCMRSTVWFPDKEKPLTHSFRLHFEGGLTPVVADAVVALQIHQNKLTPKMVAQLKAMTEALKGKYPH